MLVFTSNSLAMVYSICKIYSMCKMSSQFVNIRVIYLNIDRNIQPNILLVLSKNVNN